MKSSQNIFPDFKPGDILKCFVCETRTIIIFFFLILPSMQTPLPTSTPVFSKQFALYKSTSPPSPILPALPRCLYALSKGSTSAAKFLLRFLMDHSCLAQGGGAIRIPNFVKIVPFSWLCHPPTKPAAPGWAARG